MARFEQMLEAQSDEPLYVTDVCASIGVSERTLRLHCQHQLRDEPQGCSTLYTCDLRELRSCRNKQTDILRGLIELRKRGDLQIYAWQPITGKLLPIIRPSDRH